MAPSSRASCPLSVLQRDLTSGFADRTTDSGQLARGFPTRTQSGRPERPPEGLGRAYAYWSEDEQEVIGVSFWDSRESCDAWRASEAETRRRAAMAPYVVEEQEAFYRGRELAVPVR